MALLCLSHEICDSTLTSDVLSLLAWGSTPTDDLYILVQLKNAKIVPVEKATPANCGAKAAACAALAKVAADASFGTPAGICLPFGSMEATVKVCHLDRTCTR